MGIGPCRIYRPEMWLKEIRTRLDSWVVGSAKADNPGLQPTRDDQATGVILENALTLGTGSAGVNGLTRLRRRDGKLTFFSLNVATSGPVTWYLPEMEPPATSLPTNLTWRMP